MGRQMPGIIPDRPANVIQEGQVTFTCPFPSPSLKIILYSVQLFEHGILGADDASGNFLVDKVDFMIQSGGN